ncbi:MAG: carbamoyl phosphate synthase large subunit, partial [Pseudohongiella sp.]|nr:carbamoyl phosphate synthase large subunit [Pseudohongiella sp.]
STGEVMGVGETFAEAFAKAQMGAGEEISKTGTVFISVRDADKPKVADIARSFHELGFSMVATTGTAAIIEAAGLPVNRVNKVLEGRPHVVDMIKNEEIQLIVNTTEGKQAIADSSAIRRTALRHDVFCTTTLAGASAVCEALKCGDNLNVYTIQELHARLPKSQ